jgi:ribosomal protein S17
MTKVFSHAGVSRLNGVIKARFANDALRVKVLAKGGHTDIDLVEFLEPLTKDAAIAKLIEMEFGKGNAEIEEALASEMDKRTEVPKAPKATKVVKAKPAKAITIESIKAKAKPAVTKPAPKSTKTKAQIEAELANLEDAAY